MGQKTFLVHVYMKGSGLERNSSPKYTCRSGSNFCAKPSKLFLLFLFCLFLFFPIIFFTQRSCQLQTVSFTIVPFVWCKDSEWVPTNKNKISSVAVEEWFSLLSKDHISRTYVSVVTMEINTEFQLAMFAW